MQQPAQIAPFKISESSKNVLASVREVFPDHDIAKDEGLPEDLEARLARRTGPVTFHFGSSSFTIGADKEATCLFPREIYPISWRYVQIFVLECGALVKVRISR